MDSSSSPNRLPVACDPRVGAAFVLLAACAFSPACATVINGSTQRVAVASDPPGAQVYVNGDPAGVTPAFVEVPRRDQDLELRLEKDGYETAVLGLERRRSGWLAGNVLLAGVPVNEYTLGMWVGNMALYGIVGSLQDARSGGAYKRPDLVRATLDPVPFPNDATAEREHRRLHPPGVGGAPGVAGRKLRNRLVPMQLADRARRLTGEWSGWNAHSQRGSSPATTLTDRDRGERVTCGRNRPRPGGCDSMRGVK